MLFHTFIKVKNCLLLFLLLAILPPSWGQKSDTFLVHFAFNDPKISKQASDFIDNLIFKDKLIHGQRLIVLGYADYVGDNTYNNTLSATRAKNVRNYLISSGFDQKDIRLCIGKGKIEHAPIKEKDGIPADRKVQIIVDNEPHTDTLTNKTNSTFISTSSLKVNATYQLSILFESNASLILPESYVIVKSLLEFMVKNPTVKMQIEGHVCCTDPKYTNDGVDVKKGGALSWNRAKAVYDVLVEHGVSKDRLKYIGLAGTAPLVYPERTAEDEAKNRRVEVRVLSK